MSLMKLFDGVLAGSQGTTGQRNASQPSFGRGEVSSIAEVHGPCATLPSLRIGLSRMRRKGRTHPERVSRWWSWRHWTSYCITLAPHRMDG